MTKRTDPEAGAAGWTAACLTAAGVFAAVALAPGRAPQIPAEFGRIPVVYQGRVRALDAVARETLAFIAGSSSVDASAWLARVLFDATHANEDRIIRVDDPGRIGLADGSRHLFSYTELRPHLAEITAQAYAARAENSDAKQGDVVRLARRVDLFGRLENTIQLADAAQIEAGLADLESKLRSYKPSRSAKTGVSASLPTAPALAPFVAQFHFLDQQAAFASVPRISAGALTWVSVGDAVSARMMGRELSPGVAAWARMADAYRGKSMSALKREASAHLAWLKTVSPGALTATQSEFSFVSYAPFSRLLALYAVALLFAGGGAWAGAQSLRRVGGVLFAATLAAHSASLGIADVVEGYRSATALFSWTAYAGWSAAVAVAVVARFVRRDLAAAAGAAAAVAFLLIPFL